ncbi:hypothetical protein T05_7182 [Trichinella murrelli]|uniref:Uncharacterized protein n=1 Tax=Trichinella murrelli TaxID=144512 RepID=A0A0V0UE90_9BILA|nr:hypothetical protein T05_7182 [Trichinella murrelli]
MVGLLDWRRRLAPRLEAEKEDVAPREAIRSKLLPLTPTLRHTHTHTHIHQRHRHQIGIMQNTPTCVQSHQQAQIPKSIVFGNQLMYTVSHANQAKRYAKEKNHFYDSHV